MLYICVFLFVIFCLNGTAELHAAFLLLHLHCKQTVYKSRFHFIKAI
uniref:Uncharacterized protein n=1 Tax=Anguilla anguilla TaxID=7936 RepID=A0A0E9WV19_ANGAN